MQDGEDRVRKALEKKGAFGPDVDMGLYDKADMKESISDLKDADKDTRQIMENVGVVTDDSNRAGTIMFIDNSMSHCSNKMPEGVDLMPTQEALKKFDWLKDYYWKAMDPEKDKFTARTYLEEADGYFIHVKPGMKVVDPIQSCMLIGTKKGAQVLHNIILVDEGASLEIITGCTTGNHVNDALHIGVSEIYVKKGASCVFSMIHHWGTKTVVRPRTACIVEEGGSFVNNYVLLNPVGTLQSFPVCKLNGKGASCKFNTVCLADAGSNVDTGGSVELNAPETTAEVISRNIVRSGNIIARGRLMGNAPGIKAHLECRSIMIGEKGSTEAIPELGSTVPDVEMTHEAAVGKIARDQIEYLMSRGLSEDDAVSMIVRGFLVGGIKGLPDHLRAEIDEAMEKANLGN